MACWIICFLRLLIGLTTLTWLDCKNVRSDFGKHSRATRLFDGLNDTKHLFDDDVITNGVRIRENNYFAV
jgi:hypothetical protein